MMAASAINDNAASSCALGWVNGDTLTPSSCHGQTLNKVPNIKPAKVFNCVFYDVFLNTILSVRQIFHNANDIFRTKIQALLPHLI